MFIILGIQNIINDYTDIKKINQKKLLDRIIEVFSRPVLFRTEMNLSEKYDEINNFIYSFEESKCPICGDMSDYTTYICTDRITKITTSFYTAVDGCPDCYLSDCIIIPHEPLD